MTCSSHSAESMEYDHKAQHTALNMYCGDMKMGTETLHMEDMAQSISEDILNVHTLHHRAMCMVGMKPLCDIQ